MKFVTAFLLLCVSVCSHGQTRADYEQAMQKYIKCYNASDVDCINAMYSKIAWGDMMKSTGRQMNSKEEIADFHREYGNILSYKYLGVTTSDQVTIYIVTSDKSTFPMGMSLGSDGIETFRFNTSSDEIDEMMKKDKQVHRSGD